MSPLRSIEMYGARARYPIPSSLISMLGNGKESAAYVLGGKLQNLVVCLHTIWVAVITDAFALVMLCISPVSTLYDE